MAKTRLGLNSRAKEKFNDIDPKDEVSKIGYAGMSLDDDELFRFLASQFNSLYAGDPQKSVKMKVYKANAFRIVKSLYMSFDEFTDDSGRVIRPLLVFEAYIWKTGGFNSGAKLFLNFKQSAAGPRNFNSRIIDLEGPTEDAETVIEKTLYAIQNISKIAGKLKMFPETFRKSDYEEFLRGFTSPGYVPKPRSTSSRIATDDEIERWMKSDEMYRDNNGYATGFSLLKFWDIASPSSNQSSPYNTCRIQFFPSASDLNIGRLKEDAARSSRSKILGIRANSRVFDTLELIESNEGKIAQVLCGTDPIYKSSFLIEIKRLWEELGCNPRFIDYYLIDKYFNDILEDNLEKSSSALKLLTGAKEGTEEFGIAKACVKSMLIKKKNSNAIKMIIQKMKASGYATNESALGLGLNKRAKGIHSSSDAGVVSEEMFVDFSSKRDTTKAIMKKVVSEAPSDWWVSCIGLLSGLLQIIPPSFIFDVKTVFSVDFEHYTCFGGSSAQVIDLCDDQEKNHETYRIVLKMFREFVRDNIDLPASKSFYKTIENAPAGSFIKLEDKERIYNFIDNLP